MSGLVPAQQSFPMGTDYMSWESWNGAFIEWFGEQPIPFNSEEDWRITASVISGLPNFSVYPVPDDTVYETWQEWASQTTAAINGPSNY
jgi:hypothetical protein